jgi:CHAD domain-containing protein
MVATAALRVGVAAAIAERDRRAARTRRTRERQFALLPGERPAEGLRRMALGQFDLAIELLGADGGAVPTAEAVHETRKALKRLRTLVRLLEGELGEQAAAREQLLLREAGRRLAGARDAEVMVSTLEQLQQRHPRKLARRPGVARLRQRLVTERERATARLLGDDVVRAEVLSDLRGARARTSEWAPRDEGGFTRVEPALARIYGQGRRRHRRASRRRSDRALAMHRWRKRVKDLRYATEALSRTDPGPEGRAAIAAVRALAPTRKRSSERTGDLMPKLARRADALGEMLGEEHDLFLLAERVREGGTGCGRRTRRALLKLIERRRTRLTRRALQDGARLYGRPPKKLLRRVRRAYAREARM